MNETVYLVDDDPAIRDSLILLCEADGLAAETCASADEFLARFDPNRPGCLVLDVKMPGMSGPELHAELNRRGHHLPIIFLSAQGTIALSVQAIKEGAVDFLTKPMDSHLLLERIHGALRYDSRRFAARKDLDARCAWLASLTRREHEIMEMVIAGHSSKKIAQKIGISFRTVEIHRSHLLSKAGCDNMMVLARRVAECTPVPLEGTERP